MSTHAKDVQPQEAQSHEFRAEIRQLLDILVHSVYTAKDIFIRELISNAADALEKVRFLQVTGQPLHEPERELEIRIETKKEDGASIFIIADSGIGMTEEEVHANIGTIARSGTTAFLQSVQEAQKKDLSLIGRFGVGFYSVFMAGEKVTLTTRSATPGAKPVTWTSDGLGSYTLAAAPDDTPRGTRIEVVLRRGEGRFADADTVRWSIRRYSNFVAFPVLVNGDRVNTTTALWREPPTRIKDSEYSEFFKFLTHEAQDPLARLHLSVDAPIQFAALLFVPRTNTETLGFGEGKVSVQLYIKRVLIDAENEDLLPRYLRFVQGVVESEDLPLNISRETLQENAVVFKIRETLTRKLLDLFLELAKSKPDEYAELWRTFGRILKEGHSDYPNRERFQGLLRFNCSTHADDKGLCGLEDYVQSMPGSQKAIYYLSGASREALQRDPRLEIFRKKGIPVLYLYDVADEFVLGTAGKYKEYPIRSADQVKPEDLKGIGKPEIILPDGAQDDAKARAAGILPLIERFKEILGERVSDVRPSERLVDSPACLVGAEGQLSGHLDKVLRLINKDSELPRRVLELNPEHALIRNLTALVEKDRKDALVERACEQLYEGSLLVDGYLTDPHRLVQRMNEVLEDAAAMKAGGN